MICKPNDLAMVVRNTSGIACIGNVIGSPVRVIDLRHFNLLSYGPAWNYAPALCCPKCGGELDLMLDADLQPIRPPSAETETPIDVIRELQEGAFA